MIEGYNNYAAKQRFVLLEATELNAQQQQTQDFYMQKPAEQQKPHTCRTASHICDVCSGIIQKGEQYTRRRLQTGFGFPEGTHYTTYHKHYPTCAAVEVVVP
jgi:hypothetical protein